jgi:hypothetical protein
MSTCTLTSRPTRSYRVSSEELTPLSSPMAYLHKNDIDFYPLDFSEYEVVDFGRDDVVGNAASPRGRRRNT